MSSGNAFFFAWHNRYLPAPYRNAELIRGAFQKSGYVFAGLILLVQRAVPGLRKVPSDTSFYAIIDIRNKISMLMIVAIRRLE